MENIRVALRMRPINKREIDNNDQMGWKISGGNTIALLPQFSSELIAKKKISQSSKTSYTFDACFSDQDDNWLVYDKVVRPVATGSLEGINGTIFMYGQTGCGKTFTMMGMRELTDGGKNIPKALENSDSDNSVIEDENQQQQSKKEKQTQGILISSLKEIFREAQEDEDVKKYFFRCSYIEIYNDNVHDLLQRSKDKMGEPLKIVEDGQKEFVIQGLLEENVSNLSEVLEILKQGELNRHFAATAMNHNSSRSHTIFRLLVKTVENKFISKAKESQTKRRRASLHLDQMLDLSKLQDVQAAQSQMGADSVITEAVMNFVDLAGSEKANIHSEDIRQKEGQNINKSLFFLTQVISMKSDKKNDAHIPYRNSPLTKILKTSLGGNSRTLVILALTPAYSQYENSMSTLRFGVSAKKIENKISANMTMKGDDEAIKMVIAEYEKKIKDLMDQISDERKCRQQLESQVEKLESDNKTILSSMGDGGQLMAQNLKLQMEMGQQGFQQHQQNDDDDDNDFESDKQIDNSNKKRKQSQMILISNEAVEEELLEQISELQADVSGIASQQENSPENQEPPEEIINKPDNDFVQDILPIHEFQMTTFSRVKVSEMKRQIEESNDGYDDTEKDYETKLPRGSTYSMSDYEEYIPLSTRGSTFQQYDDLEPFKNRGSQFREFNEIDIPKKDRGAKPSIRFSVLQKQEVSPNKKKGSILKQSQYSSKASLLIKEDYSNNLHKMFEINGIYMTLEEINNQKRITYLQPIVNQLLDEIYENGYTVTPFIDQDRRMTVLKDPLTQHRGSEAPLKTEMRDPFSIKRGSERDMEIIPTLQNKRGSELQQKRGSEFHPKEDSRLSVYQYQPIAENDWDEDESTQELKLKAQQKASNVGQEIRPQQQFSGPGYGFKNKLKLKSEEMNHSRNSSLDEQQQYTDKDTPPIENIILTTTGYSTQKRLTQSQMTMQILAQSQKVLENLSQKKTQQQIEQRQVDVSNNGQRNVQQAQKYEQPTVQRVDQQTMPRGEPQQGGSSRQSVYKDESQKASVQQMEIVEQPTIPSTIQSIYQNLEYFQNATQNKVVNKPQYKVTVSSRKIESAPSQNIQTKFQTPSYLLREEEHSDIIEYKDNGYQIPSRYVPPKANRIIQSDLNNQLNGQRRNKEQRENKYM